MLDPELTRGDFGLPGPPLDPGVSIGEPVRPTTGGVAVRVGGGVGRLIEGLSQEEKKSSSAAAGAATSSIPSITTSSGYLSHVLEKHRGI